jgi:hypothetical protein
MERIKKDPSVWITDLQALYTYVGKDLADAQIVQRTLGHPRYEGMTSIENAFIPAQLVLADLALYLGNYSKAAELYSDFLYTYVLDTNGRRIYWLNNGFTGSSSGTANTNEYITAIYNSSEDGMMGSTLAALCYPVLWSRPLEMNCTFQVQPSAASLNTWNKQIYAYLPDNATALDEVIYTNRDLRGTMGDVHFTDYISINMSQYIWDSYESTVSSQSTSGVDSDTIPFINKFGLGKSVRLYRTGTVYLRLAEAINRLNKPSLAFAILKYGARDDVKADPAKVNPDELEGTDFWNFPATLFPRTTTADRRAQIGMHARGSGAADQNIYYLIPALATRADSVSYVDNLLVEEMAMETAFEGNRFQDLMRFAQIYGNEYLADRVAVRRGATDAALRAKLLDKNKWYLPHD